MHNFKAYYLSVFSIIDHTDNQGASAVAKGYGGTGGVRPKAITVTY
jgi:hypothetical protein